MKKVLIPTKLNGIAKQLLEKSGLYLVIQDEGADIVSLAKEHTDAYALIVRSEKVTPEVMDLLPQLKVVIRAGAGYNTIDTTYARSHSIDVMNTPGANSNAVAEEVIAMMLADARHIVKADPSVRSGKWEKKNFMGKEVTGKTMGIVGLGFIGRLVAKRLAGFEMRLMGYDPFIAEDRARELGIELADMSTLFEQCDYISLHIPENDETRGMINYDLLSLMKENATLVNCARAGIINEADLQKVKEEKHVHYLNDVYPKDEEGEKSVAAVADLMLPHLGASTAEANLNAARRAAEQLIEFDEKGVTSYIVNRDIPEGLDESFADLAYTLARLARSMVGKDAQLKLIETSFYGYLKPFSEWLIIPTVAALSEEFDRSMDRDAALTFLQDMGIDYEDRRVDDTKGFDNSITIDLTASRDAGNLRRCSVRGTVAEGTMMVSRIDDFDKLYFDPKGITCVFIYRDRPGVLSQVATGLAAADINIDDVRNPHDSKGSKSIAILKVNKVVDDETIKKITAQIDAEAAFCVTL